VNKLRFPFAGAFALAVISLCVLFFAPAVVSQPASARINPIRPSQGLFLDETHTVPLPGNTPTIARTELDLGPIPGETRLDRMILLMKPSASQQAELNALIAAQQNPHSPLYHQWLKPAQFGARFGVGAAVLSQTTAWLKSHGFTVDELTAGRTMILFSGSEAQVEEAFHSPVHRFRSATGEHIANTRDPEIPAELSNSVAGIVSLHNIRRQPAIRAHVPRASTPQFTLYGSHYLYPGDLATIYNINPLYTSGTTGAGTSIAIAGRSNILASDVAAFRSASALGANPPTVLLPNGNPGLAGADQDEATLDVEWAGAIAPSANVTLVAEASTATTDGVDLASAYIVNHALAPVVSVSFGSCEQQMGAAELTFYNNLWQQAASQGMSVFVASGDSGPAACDLGSATKGTTAAVNGLCSSPYSTCVGGTEFSESANASQYWSGTNGPGNVSALSYIPETVWNQSASNTGTDLWSSGGGLSTLYLQPAWQHGVTGASRNEMRAVPDVSLTAASHDGYIIEENGTGWIVSGTSASTPTFAALMALIVESQGASQGTANPTLYALAENNSGTSENPFHPTLSGNNDVPGVQGYTANGDTYNMATGLGSVDADLLVSNWTTPQSQPPSLGVTPQTNYITVLLGTSTSFHVAVATGGSFSGNIALSVTGLPQGVTASWSQSELPGAGTVILTFAAGIDAATGPFPAIIQAQGDGVTATVQLYLAIDEPPLGGHATPISGGIHAAP
jgi:pseudomonalisin